MPFITSKFRTGLDNPSIDARLVAKIKVVMPKPTNPKLWVTYFLGFDENNREKVVRTWFHQSERERGIDLERIQEKYPDMKVV